MQTGGENDHSKTGTDGGYCGQIGRQYRVGIQSPAAKAAKTQEGEGKIIGIVVADCFFNENTFYSNLYRALLRAGINRKSVMLTVGYPPLPFCLDAGSRQKLHRAGSAAPALYCTP